MLPIRGYHILLVMLATAAVGAAPEQAKPVRAVVPSEIQWTTVQGYPSGYARAMLEGELGKAGPFTYRVRLPAGFTFQPHTHTEDEHVTVLQGAWSLGIGSAFDASRLKSYPAGSFLVVPAGTAHFVTAEGETVIQVHGIGQIGFRLVGDAKSTTQR